MSDILAAARKDLVPVLPEIENEGGTGDYYADWVANTIEVPKTGDYAPLPVQTALDPELQRLVSEQLRARSDALPSRAPLQGRSRDRGQR